MKSFVARFISNYCKIYSKNISARVHEIIQSCKRKTNLLIIFEYKFYFPFYCVPRVCIFRQLIKHPTKQILYQHFKDAILFLLTNRFDRSTKYAEIIGYTF